MNSHSASASVADFPVSAFEPSSKDESVAPAGARVRAAPYIAFFITLFASMAAAAAVVTTDAPVLLVGVF